MVSSNIKQQILSRLKENLSLHKVILFGSFAYGTPHEDSDVDLLVVIEGQIIPKNYDENIQNYLKVSSTLRDIKKKIPIDLIVHTRAMHDKFLKLESSFSREIVEKGEILYEEKLDKLYVDSRYPGEFGLLPDGKPTVEDAESFREVAESIYNEIKSSLEKQGNNTPDPEK